MEEKGKLQKIKKSCKAGYVVSRVFCILSIVGCVCALVGGIVILSMGKEFDEKVAQEVQNGNVSIEEKIGGYQVLGVSLGDPSSLRSDVPAIREALQDHPYCIEVSLYCFLAALETAIIAVMMGLAASAFSMIRKEDSPFTEKVIKRVLIVMIALSAIVLLTAGLGQGALSAILTWVVYSILDYGKVLQIQSDETL